MRIPSPARRSARWAHLPRRTVRLRLTLLYSGLFLLSGAMLLGFTYFFVRDNPGNFVFTVNGGAAAGAIEGVPTSGKTLNSGHGQSQSHGQVSVKAGHGGALTRTQVTRHNGQYVITTHSTSSSPPSVLANPDGLSPKQIADQTKEFSNLAQQQVTGERSALLFWSGVALGIMFLFSLALGWMMAGRVLRPLRTITSATRDISATNLHERLGLDGPNDELKELGDTIDELLTRLDAAFASQRQFVANASHELRTPLTRQRTLAQVALDDPGATVESLRQAHERILASGEQQEELIEALLTLSRVQAGTDHREPFDLSPLVAEVVESRHVEADVHQVSLSSELSAAPVMGDQRLVKRLVVNLVENAIRHNVPDGSVQVVTDRRGGHAVLSITNDGPVIPSDEIERLFEPFQRLGGERTVGVGGFGLGLSIVRAVADAHEADLVMRPRSAGGVTVEVRFSLRTDRPESHGTDGVTPVEAVDPEPEGE
jgi:signal transduction histidine kinase